jgi:hypothetical protein
MPKLSPAVVNYPHRGNFSGGVGMPASGAAVTQITSRATGVTLHALTGKITTDPTSLAAEASAEFIVTNNKVELGDVVVCCIRSGAVAVGTIATISTVAAGSFTIRVTNNNAGAGVAETGALVIDFMVLKAAA